MAKQAFEVLCGIVFDVLLGLFLVIVVKAILNWFNPARTLLVENNRSSNKRFFFAVLTGPPAVVLILGRLWLEVVSHYVPEPYLDEVFHIPQAQRYCAGRFYEWDDKITTPPGLYLLSLVMNHCLATVRPCSVHNLRLVNVYSIALVTVLASECRSMIEQQHQLNTPQTLSLPDKERAIQDQSLYALHTALNIGLFPLLFFLSALYYTDIVSTLSVLVCYRVHLGRLATVSSSNDGKKTTFFSDAIVIVAGVVALSMRQTNVFWVVVYMGGLEAVHVIKNLTPRHRSNRRRQLECMDDKDTPEQVFACYYERFATGSVHDPPSNLAWADDLVVHVFSLVVAAFHNPVPVMLQIMPYVGVLAAFCDFVLWNGGVVLGDKSNHVATIHVAQLLYLWPLLLFFLLPLLHVIWEIYAWLCAEVTEVIEEAMLDMNVGMLDLVNLSMQAGLVPERRRGTSKVRPSAHNKTLLTVGGWAKRLLLLQKSYHVGVDMFLLLAGLVIARYNTILHPFTLADNRHYMFYVFRRTILLGWLDGDAVGLDRLKSSVRFFLVPVYIICFRLVQRCFSGCRTDFSTRPTLQCPASLAAAKAVGGIRWLNSPWMDKNQRARVAPMGRLPGRQAAGDDGSVTSEHSVADSSCIGSTASSRQEIASHRRLAKKEKKPLFSSPSPSLSYSESPAPSRPSSVAAPPVGQPMTYFSPWTQTSPLLSTSLFWFAATALSLVTAPLVEPRYFILPWVFLRLNLPAWRMHICDGAFVPVSYVARKRQERVERSRVRQTRGLMASNDTETAEGSVRANGHERNRDRMSEHDAPSTGGEDVAAALHCHSQGQSQSVLSAVRDGLLGRVVTFFLPLAFGQDFDLRLAVETAWFLFINAVTMYVFIGRPFYWYDAEGNIADGGRLQRFMW